MTKYLLTGLLLAGTSVVAQAQISNFSWIIGGGAVMTRGTAPVRVEQLLDSGIQNETYEVRSVDSDALLFTFGLSYSTPLYQFSDEQALGICLNATGGIQGATNEQQDNQRFILDLPQYVTYRYGAKSSKHSKSTFGLGLGAGYRFGYTLPIIPYSAPSVMAEVVYGGRKTDWYLRLSTDPVARQFYNEFSSEGKIKSFTLRETQLQLGYTF